LPRAGLVAQFLGGEHRAHLDPGRRAVGREREDRLEGVRDLMLAYPRLAYGCEFGRHDRPQHGP
jgi:hypothetical protein